ncbi:hypothetical protein [Chamaesiphon sp.]|uniref:hypothetical protein n=1 Tax=Chamaesiphon sp. TaxID=2814140 RepID=UPI003593731B
MLAIVYWRSLFLAIFTNSWQWYRRDRLWIGMLPCIYTLDRDLFCVFIRWYLTIV